MDFPLAESAVKVYRECASVPSLSSACLQKTGNNVLTVHSTWSQRDLERDCNVKFRQAHVVTISSIGSAQDVFNPGTSTELNSEQMMQWSPSGKLKAVLRKVKDKKGDEKQYMEVWNNHQKIHNINLTALDQHGKVCDDGEFGCLEWSKDESKLLYVAEKKQPKGVSYFDKSCTTQEKPDTDIGKKDDETKGDQFLHRQDWGEQLVGKHCPVPCILDLQTCQVTVPKGLPNDVSIGQAIWTPNGSGIVFTGWKNEPYRLGLIYCRNRRSIIYHLDLSSLSCNKISMMGQSVRSPVFSPDGTRLIYIQNECHGPHMQCGQLIVCDWESKECRVAVDVVHRPTEDKPFTGLYVGRFDQHCWLDNETIITSTAWRSEQTIIAINTVTGEVTRLTNDPVFGSWSFCDLKDRFLLAFRSAPNNSGQLVLGMVPQGDVSGIEWKCLHDPGVVSSDVTWSIITLKPKPENLASDIDFEAIILKPKSSSEKKPPLIVWPHGGPHSVITAGYSSFGLAFCQLGFVVTFVNYRGSIGFGKASIDSLPGYVGTNDVHDVQRAAEAVIEQGLADPDRVSVSGGSHGGFLSTHMIGQYPDFYKACVTRNPVTNVAAMLGGTDIPSWTMKEAGIDFDFKMAPSAEMYAKMFNCSPMAHIDKVKAPTLLMLGADDLRVPPQQGLRYHEMLKARGVKTRLLMYPENSHPIGKVDAEADCFINMYTWITEHL